MRPYILTFTVLTAVATLSSVASAQFGGGNRNSTGGGSNFGGGGGGGMGGGSSFGSSLSGGGMGGGGMGGGSAFGTGLGSGSGGFGAGLNGAFGQSSGMGMGGQNQGGQLLGTNPNQFIGGNGGNQGNQQGNGRNQLGGGQNGFNQFGNNGGNRRGNLNGLNSLMNNNFNGGGNGNGNNQIPAIRPRQKVAFDYPVPKGDTLHTTLQTQLTRVAIRNPGLANVALTTNPGGEVVIRGAVKSEADAKLAVNLLRLEPGVRSVRNELTFPEAKTDAE